MTFMAEEWIVGEVDFEGEDDLWPCDCQAPCRKAGNSNLALNGLDPMSNSKAKARRWVEFLADQPAAPWGKLLQAHFEVGHITRLCECGCNSFDLEIPAGVSIEPIAELCRPGKIFEIVYESSAAAEVAFLVFVDERGYLSSLDVTCGDGNQAAMPDDMQLGQVIYAGS